MLIGGIVLILHPRVVFKADVKFLVPAVVKAMKCDIWKWCALTIPTPVMGYQTVAIQQVVYRGTASITEAVLLLPTHQPLHHTYATHTQKILASLDAGSSTIDYLESPRTVFITAEDATLLHNA